MTIGLSVAQTAADPETCGDGYVDPWEQCDDGNTASGDGCDSACQDEFCGDGVVQAGLGEECDDGNTASYDECSATCQDESIYYVDLGGDDAWDGRAPSWDGYSGPKATIQAAINAASPDEIVLVADGTYTGPENRNLDFGGKAITVRSIGGASSCTIDCEGAHRGVDFHSGEQPTSVLDGFTITNGSGAGGGAVKISGGSNPTIRNCIFTSNVSSTDGGAAWIYQGSAQFLNCTFTDNSAPTTGGGLFVDGNSSPIAVTDCLFDDNTAVGQGGGGIYCRNASWISVTGCTFAHNTAQSNGGGLLLRDTTSAIVIACAFHSNTTPGGDGGGIFNDGSSPVIQSCLFAYNMAGESGGGVNNWDASSPTITNCTFFLNDSSWAQGHGLYGEGGSFATVTNCILWGSLANQVAGEIGAVEYCNIQNGPAYGCFSATCIAEDPLFIDVDGPDGDPNTYEDNNLRLWSRSPCIDSGSNAAITWSSDLDDGARIQDGDRDLIAIVDFGAYEYSLQSCGDGIPQTELGEECDDGNTASGDGCSESCYEERTWYVDATCPGPLYDGSEDDPFCTIQDGIDAAATRDVVEVASGTYAGIGNRDLSFGGKTIVLQSASGAASCVIDCQGAGRGFVFDSDEQPAAALDGFTVTNGSAAQGGGIQIIGANPSVSNCVIAGNTASSDCGGGMWISGSSSTLTNCVFSDNVATINGGGVYCRDASDLKVVRCEFVNNTAPSNGGGLLLKDTVGVEVTACAFHNNTTPSGDGAGIFNDNSSPDITNCLFAYNGAGESGGGINNWNASSPTITNCTFFLNDSSSAEGHGLYGAGGSYATVTNSILWGSQLHQIAGDIGAVEYCNIQNGPAYGCFSATCIAEDPHFIDADGPDDNPGTYEDNNFELMARSPCIDFGDTEAVTQETDASGDPRVVDGDRDGVLIVDIGAFEYQLTSCGDGVEDPELGEECDDGNTLSGDGCSAYCHVEQTWYVDAACAGPLYDGTEGDPFCSIQDGIDAAETRDIVEVADGTYTGADNRNLDFGGKAITVRSAGGAASCVIDCEAAGRGFDFHSGERPASLLEGFTITNGVGNGGGAIQISSAEPTIRNCVFTSNTSPTDGGAVWIYEGGGQIIDCQFTSNTTPGYGGGIWCSHSQGTSITGCTLSSNSCGWYGGGMFISDSVSAVATCMLSDNTASVNGGGIYCRDTSDATFDRCNFVRNEAASNGGGLLLLNTDDVEVNACAFHNNTTPSGDGAGIFNDNSSPDITNCLFAYNMAGESGGGVNNWNASSPTITNCTFFLNDSSSAEGHGLYSTGGSQPWVRNSILWGSELHQIVGECSVSYCNIQNGTAYACFSSSCISEDPLFVDPDGLDDDPATYEDNSLRLTLGSPCINAGWGWYVQTATDLDGQPRIASVDGEGYVRVDMVDMGAYEYVLSHCGDGLIQWELGEECDDGNSLGGDGCSTTCHLESVWYVAADCIGPAYDGSEADPFCTIQEGIDQANHGDIVLVANGTYTGDGNRDLDFAGKAITLRSQGGAENCNIDCQGSPSEEHHGFVFQNQETMASVVDGFTITGAYAEFGGGIKCQCASPTLTNCTFSGNTADYGGGGVYAFAYSSPTLTNCTFSGNTAYFGGGLFATDYSSLTLTNCIMWGNLGGQIFILSGGSSVEYSCIQGGWAGAGNTDAAPMFADPDGPDDDPTTFEDNDYRLLGGSPCLDTGDNDAVITATDAAGRPRIVDGDDDGTATVDMGAYEYEIPVCGNGLSDVGEECDDGNSISGDGCENDCTLTVVPGDECYDNPTITDGENAYDLINATTSSPPANCGDSFSIHNDVWFDYAATCNGTVVVQTCYDDENDIDTKLMVYDGCDCPLTDDIALMCVDDEPDSECTDVGGYAWESYGTFSATLGDCYKIRVGLYSSTSAAGPGVLTVDCVPLTGCGNGTTEPGEECDDGNTIDGDGCESDCTLSPFMHWVQIGDPGNANDTEGDGYGGVEYEYAIGKFEVTAGQYTEFLDAVAADDTYGLYNSSMWSSSHGCKIERTGSSGSYVYTVAPDWADRPVNYVSWGDAARFANWLHNGQPSGAQDLTTTEDGAYYLNGATSDAALLAVTREPDARVFIPSEDEWYKAAYYDGGAGVYYDYPTSADSVPGYVNDSGNLSGTGAPFVESGSDPGGYATYDGDGGTYGIGPPYYRTEVGEWENSASPYGTFDQGGNVWEWNEAVPYGSYRGVRGGSFGNIDSPLHAAVRDGSNSPTAEGYGAGFRVAGVVEAVCGNGTTESGEECDDGNTISGDGCSADCQIEDTWYVDGSNCPGPGSGTVGDPFCTIQAGIDAAGNGDTVLVADGTYTGAGNRDIDFGGKAITVRSTSGDPDGCVIDAEGSEVDPHRGFYFHSGETAASVVEGFTITGGYSEGGGAIYCESSGPTVMACNITGNSADLGGGVFADNGWVTIQDCEIAGNTAIYADGGGIAILEGGPTVISGCAVEGNTAFADGGGIFQAGDSGTTVLSACELSGNSAYRGGGVSIGELTTISDCEIVNNTATESGGGVVNYGFYGAVISTCLISHNNAGQDGGGIYSDWFASLAVGGSTITANTALNGGGIHYFNGSGAIVNCRVGGNEATNTGGGIRGDESSVSITNCAVAGNTANTGRELYCDNSTSLALANSLMWGAGPGGVYVSGDSTADVSYSLIEGGWTGSGNIDADPLFVTPGYFDDNGTPGFTADDFWVDGDYRLRPGSPCIDAGDNDVDTDPVEPGVQPLPSDDLAGNDRIVDGNADSVATVDMGPFESAPLTPVGNGETTTVQPAGQSGPPDEDSAVAFTNLTGGGDVEVTVIESPVEGHEDSGGFASMGSMLVVDVEQGGSPLPDGQFFMTVATPFEAADLIGADLLAEAMSVRLVWFDPSVPPSGTWVLAAAANTQPSPGYEPDVLGDLYTESGAVTPDLADLSQDLGDYGVFWNTATERGFAWANVDHTSDFAAAVPSGVAVPCVTDVDCVIANDNACEWDDCDEIAGYCLPVLPNIYGDVCGTGFAEPPNGAVNLTDILCTLNAFGAGNLPNCPNSDVAIVSETDCPGGNEIVNLTDILKVLDAFGAPTSPTATFFCDCPMNP